MIELLSPVGDFECLKAAVQNGADAVYFGASSFSARAFANNFNDLELQNAITYAKKRNVKTHLTLNTLIKENELENSILLAKKAYEFGIDAIIVQDLGLAKILIDNFKDIEIHASTQMTVHNLEGVLNLKKLGFKRAVLSRELSLEEIEYICKNSGLEIEVFTHGALCISYSGQCLFSSLIGARSGNRGKCAQTCRLPFELLEENSAKKDFSKIERGYLLSTRDLCSLEYLPNLIKSGVTSLKIEGRMKPPEYVAIVTQIYRKYIDLAYKYINNEILNYSVLDDDKKALMQVFNRGGFSSGHLSSEENRNLIFKEKPNNMGLMLGKVQNYNKSKGLISCKLDTSLQIGDTISFEKENTKYKVSELMIKNKNYQNLEKGSLATFGRMKGNININDKIFKISDKNLSTLATESYKSENIKIPLECNLKILENKPIEIFVTSSLFNIETKINYNYLPEKAKKAPITKENIISQFNKTQNVCFYFDKLEIELDNNLFIPVSTLNDIRRTCITNIENKIDSSFKRSSNYVFQKETLDKSNCSEPSISLLINILNENFDYLNLPDVDRLYLPLKYFGDKKYEEIIKNICKKYNTYIYLPSIIRKNYINFAKLTLQKYISEKLIKGVVISNISHFELLKDLEINNIDLIGNYTLNIYNSQSVDILSKQGIRTFTVSPELDKTAILDLCNNSNCNAELIVYGNIPVMTMNYCLLGKSNKCYSSCLTKCLYQKKYYLKDRLGVLFRIIPDNLQTITTIYNSKTTSIHYNNFKINSARIDILDEDIDEIIKIIKEVKSGKRFEGQNYTNGNLSREI